MVFTGSRFRGVGRLWTGLFVCLTLMVGTAFPNIAFGHSKPLKSSEMVRLSGQIVVATVSAKKSRWNDRHSLIVTDYTLNIEEALKGDIPAVGSEPRGSGHKPKEGN